MKKILLMGLVFGLLFSFSNICLSIESKDDNEKDAEKEAAAALALKTHPEEVRKAITSYKQGDYLACISTMKEYTAKNPNNAVAWYYLGSAYMNIGMTKEATSAFDKVIALNTTSKLTSYAIQAQLCMNTPQRCKYENFSSAEVKKLRVDPIAFINEYHEALNKKSIKSDDVLQIENLIKGSYTNNIHPQAQDFILNERAKIKASQINSGKN